MASDALIFLLRAVCEFFACVLFLRFWMQVCRVAGRNPLATFVQALTNPVVLPARRVIPGVWGLDTATLLVAWLTLVIEITLILLLKGALADFGTAIASILLLALTLLLRLTIYLAIAAIFLQVILSWVNPGSPLAPVVSALTRPLLRPIQRVVPTIGMVDLSPLIALLMLQLVLMVPLAYLERMVGGF